MMPGDDGEPTLVDRAQRALAMVEGLAQEFKGLDESHQHSERTRIGREQRDLLIHAAVLSIVSIAEDLHELTDVQRRRLSISEFMLECEGIDAGDLFSHHYSTGRPIEDTPPL